MNTLTYRFDLIRHLRYGGISCFGIKDQHPGSSVQPRYVGVGMSVEIRHLAATPVGGKVRTLARVIGVQGKSVTFEVEAWNDHGKIGDVTHRRGIVNVVEFEKRFGVPEVLA